MVVEIKSSYIVDLQVPIEVTITPQDTQQAEVHLIKAIEFRRPKYKDVKKLMGGGMSDDLQFESVVTSCASLVGLPDIDITTHIINKLDVIDIYAINDFVGSLFEGK